MKVDKDSWLFQLLTSNRFHVLLTFIAGILCFIPLSHSFFSEPEDFIFRDQILSIESKIPAIAAIALFIPLSIDFIFDISDKYIFRNEKKIKDKLIKQSSIDLLNDYEKFMFLLGIVVLPIVMYFPESTPNLSLVYLSCERCQHTLVVGAIITSLCRHDKKLFPAEVTVIILVSLIIGAGLSIHSYNTWYRGPISVIQIAYLIFTYLPILLFILLCCRWLFQTVIGESSLLRKQPSTLLPTTAPPTPLLKKLVSFKSNSGSFKSTRKSSTSFSLRLRSFLAFETLRKKLKNEKAIPADTYLLYRIVYVVATLLLLVYMVVFHSLHYEQAMSDTRATSSAMVPIVLFELAVLLITMRKVKYSAIENLVSTKLKSFMCVVYHDSKN